ncbi:MAG TPA: hypothetical protein VFI46_00550 [Jiangellaceae bacterium]|nr:hypothetical protein [Jiangellaceae bacterium]
MAVLVAAACSDSGGSDAGSGSATTEAETVAPVTLATVPRSERVDLDTPTFSDPTTVDNPLFPISNQHSAVYLGNDEGNPLKVEVTLLPETKVIEVDGEPTEVLVSQFISFVGGRVDEVTFDWYAQDDTGAVWFFGEDVTRYEDGVLLDHEGSWLAGEDGPPAMIMPADPQLGDVFRSENIPDFILEEVVVQDLGVTVPGPRGPIDGAMLGQELHIYEGLAENKTFAPGYGEFTSGIGSNVETMALAAPVDALSSPPPAELTAISNGAIDILDAAETEDWDGVAAALGAMNAQWAMHRATGDVPPLLAIQMDHALDAVAGDPLSPALDDRNVEGVREAAVDVAQASLDLQLQYRSPAEIDLARFGWWARRLVVDSSSNEPDPGHIAGDVTTLELIWDRIAHTLDDTAVSDIEAQLADLRAAADTEDVVAATQAAPRLVETVSSLNPSA